MKRRDFLKKSVKTLSFLPFLKFLSLAQNENTPPKNDQQTEKIDFTFNNITFDNINEILSNLYEKQMLKGRLFLFKPYLLDFSSDGTSISDIKFYDRFKFFLFFKSRFNSFLLHYDKFDTKKIIEEIDKLYFLTKDVKKLSLPNNTSSNSKNQTIPKLTNNEDNELLKKTNITIKYKEKKDYRQKPIKEFITNFTIEEKLKVISKFNSFKDRLLDKKIKISYNWRESSYKFSNWYLSGEYMNDFTQSWGFQIRLKTDKTEYFKSFGGVENIVDFINLSGKEMENLFLSLKNEIEEDEKLSKETLTPDIYDIIFDSGQTGVFLAKCLFPFFDYKNILIKNEIVKKYKLPKILSVIDNPKLSNSSINLLFDFEGNKISEELLIENGKINDSFLGILDNWDNKRGKTGRSFLINNAGETLISPTTIYIEPGTDKREDLLSSNKTTILVKEIDNIIFDINTGNFIFRIKSGYLLKNGKKDKIIENNFVTDSVFNFLNKVKGIGSDLYIDNYGDYYYNKILYYPAMPTVLFTNVLILNSERG